MMPAEVRRRGGTRKQAVCFALHERQEVPEIFEPEVHVHVFESFT